MPRTVIACIVAPLLVVSLSACGDSRTEAEIARDAAAPQVTDSLYRLVRRQLTVRNPIPLESALFCETGRIMATVGENEGGRRIEAMYDSVYQWRDRDDRRRVGRILQLRGYDFSPGVCDTVDRILLRTDSLPEPRPGE